MRQAHGDEQGLNMKLRKQLDLFANVVHIKVKLIPFFSVSNCCFHVNSVHFMHKNLFSGVFLVKIVQKTCSVESGGHQDAPQGAARLCHRARAGRGRVLVPRARARSWYGFSSILSRIRSQFLVVTQPITLPIFTSQPYTQTNYRNDT